MNNTATNSCSSVNWEELGIEMDWPIDLDERVLSLWKIPRIQPHEREEMITQFIFEHWKTDNTDNIIRELYDDKKLSLKWVRRLINNRSSNPTNFLVLWTAERIDKNLPPIWEINPLSKKPLEEN